MLNSYKVIGLLISLPVLLGFLHCGGGGASTGSLDGSFDTDGKVTTAIGTGNDLAYSSAIQSDGKIIVAGASHDGNDYNFAVLRYESGGTLDSSFGGVGYVTTSINSSEDDIAYSVVLQSDSKILVAGVVNNGANNDFALARYNTDGTLDTTFGSGGVLSHSLGSSDEEARKVLLQSDGKIIAAGTVDDVGKEKFAIVRYSSTGSFDPTFTTNGRVAVEFPSDASGYAAGLDSNRKIIVGGTSDGDFAIARIETDGDIDSSFGTSGVVTFNLTGTEQIEDLYLDSTNNIIAAGHTTSGTSKFVVGKISSTGSPSPSFGTSGSTSFNICPTSSDKAYAVAEGLSSKILVAGLSDPGLTTECEDYTTIDMGTARLTAAGTLDGLWDADGVLTIDFSGANDEVHSISVQSDGKVVFVGHASNGSNFDIAVARANQ